MGFLRKIMSNKKASKIITIVLAVAIGIVAVIGIVSASLQGKKYDAEKAVEEYVSAPADTSQYFTGLTEEELKGRLSSVEKQILGLLSDVNIEELLYTDETVSAVARFTAEFTGEDFLKVKFKALKKNYPDAYSYVKGLQDQGKTWADLGTIPFGITPGDKDAFIKACGAGAEHFGNKLFDVMMKAPAAYDQALVPMLESLHTGTMPELTKFVSETGLSGSKRIEFLAQKLLTIVEPLSKAPLTYLCDILPDFARSFGQASEYLNSKPKVAEKTGFKIPEVNELLNQVLGGLNMSAPALDMTYIAKLGTASVGESAANRGERITICGNRQAVFAYLTDYLFDAFVYGENFSALQKLIYQDMKSDEMQTGKVAEIMASTDVKNLIADVVDIASKLCGRQAPDVAAQVNAYNSEIKDFSGLFNAVITEDVVSGTIDALDVTIVAALSDINIDGFVYCDAFATTIVKLTADICGKQPADLAFAALKKSFPEAYKYMSDIKAAGKTWDDVEVIPFGIVEGDRKSFIKAVGAGAEHFGDTMSLCLLASPTCYEELLMPLFESLHTGPMPKLKDFIASAGLDSAKRMEEVAEKLLTVMEPLKVAPLNYLLEMLPDFISSYNKAQAFFAADPNLSSKVGLNLVPLKDMLGGLVGELGITLPDFDFATIEKMGTARVAASGDYNGERMEIVGDREVVLMSLSDFIVQTVKADGNLSAITGFIGGKLGMDTSIIDTVVGTISGLDIGGSLSGAAGGVTDALGGITDGLGGLGDSLGGIGDTLGGIAGGIAA